MRRMKYYVNENDRVFAIHYTAFSQLLYCLQHSNFYFVNKIESLTYVVNSPTFQLFCMDAMPEMAYTILDVPFVLIFDTYPHSGH